MGSPWIGVLLKPVETLSLPAQDDESPVLAVVPILAGICMIFAWVVTFPALMTLPTMAGFALLVGPPFILLSSWWGRLCLNAVAKVLGGRASKENLVIVVAWSWLPLFYLSLVAMVFSRLATNGELLVPLQGIATIWQLFIIGAALRKTLDFKVARAVSLVLLAFILYLITVTACGYALGFLVNDWFEIAGML